MKISKYDGDEGSLLCVSFFTAFLMSPYNCKSESIHTIGTCTGNTIFSKSTLAVLQAFQAFSIFSESRNMPASQLFQIPSLLFPPSSRSSLCLYLYLFHYYLFFFILSNFSLKYRPENSSISFHSCLLSQQIYQVSRAPDSIPYPVPQKTFTPVCLGPFGKKSTKDNDHYPFLQLCDPQTVVPRLAKSAILED